VDIKLKWHERHLHWIWVFGLVSAYVIMEVVGSIFEAQADLVGYLVFLAVMLPVSIWVLRRKNRSLWWLLLMGWCSPLWLGHKSGFCFTERRRDKGGML
jgi:hypothetical protein